MSSSKDRVSKIVDAMFEKDLFSQWLGIERLEEKEGYSKIRMKIRAEMCNGFEVAHGGITFSFADSAFAFASNSHGKKAVSIETSITHTRPLKTGDIITAEASLQNLSNRLATYHVKILNQEGKTAALFKGTVFRKDEDWPK